MSDGRSGPGPAAGGARGREEVHGWHVPAGSAAGGPGPSPATRQLRRALERLGTLAGQTGFEDLAVEAQRAAEPLEAGEIRVVVLGQFKRGKSSVVNALLGRPVLPTGVVPLTTVPTFLRTGPSTSITIRYADGSEEAARPGSLEDYVTERENPGNEKGVERVDVTCPARHLADGLVLVDTPGIGSAERDATERAFEFLPRVDAGLVVLSADPPIGEIELQLVVRTAELTPHLFFVFNKVDLYPEDSWREAMEYSRRQVARALDREPEDLPFFALSARRALEAAEEEDGAAEAAGLDALGELLRELGGRRAEEVARDVAGRRLQRLAAEGLGLLELEEAALRTPLAALEERTAAVRERMGDLDHYLDEVPALARSAAERAVEAAGRSLYETASAAAPELAAAIRTRAGEGGAGNRVLADGARDLAARFVEECFDHWQEENGRRIAGAFRSDLARLAGRLDEELADVRDWVADQFGIELPEHVPARDLTESRDFYYRVEGVSQHRMLDAPRFWLPRPAFRWWLARRADGLAREEVERNAGRLRGDLQYRFHDTARAFASELREHTAAARSSLEGALVRALEKRRRGEEETAREVERLEAARAEIRELTGVGRTLG